MAESSGFVFPKEAVEWSILIATYPYITGPVAGSFIVSALAYVSGSEKLEAVGRLAFITS